MSWAEAKWVRDQVLAAMENNNNSEITTNTVVTITQIPNNQYGFFIKLTDIDGETPLADVTVSGVTDPASELRTNAKGELKFYSSKATHNVTWGNLPGHLTSDMFPKTLQGYINDLTSTIVKLDMSSFYGYKITAKDNSGNILANNQVYDTSGNKFKVTDANGQLEFWSTSTSVGIAFYKGKYFYSGNVSNNTKGQLKEIDCQANTALYTGNATVGSTITFKGKSWIVAHKTGNKIYCSDNVIESETQFSSTGSGNTAYKDSILASVASTFESSLGMSAIEKLMVPTTYVHGVTARIFVASYDQMNGGWSYFNSNARRSCKYNGTATEYWTSSPGNSGGVRCVNSVGDLSTDNSTAVRGFRPSVRLPL